MNDDTSMPDGTDTDTEPTDGTTSSTASNPGTETTMSLGATTAPVLDAVESSWHRVHIPHLVMGLAFLGLVAVWAIVVPLNAVELSHARWLLPLPWLAAGAAGLAATVLSGRRRP